MSGEVETRPGRTAALLAALSVGCFWALPFAPMLALGALTSTAGGTGLSRRLAVTGAILCIAYTAALAVLFTRLAWQAWA